jgi:hypothetical protein
VSGRDVAQSALHLTAAVQLGRDQAAEVGAGEAEESHRRGKFRRARPWANNGLTKLPILCCTRRGKCQAIRDITMAESSPEKAGVGGSIPSLATIKFSLLRDGLPGFLGFFTCVFTPVLLS